MGTDTITYIIDRRDRIVSVSGPWDAFADANDGVDVHAADVCGRRIWDFVAGDVTRMWLTACFQLARLRGQRAEQRYRCDSPSLRRFMRMYVEPVPGQAGSLLVVHDVLGVEERPGPVRIRAGAQGSGAPLMLRCSFCGRVMLSGAWVEPQAEQGAVSGGLLVAYSVCDDCHRLSPFPSALDREPAWR